MQATTHPFHYDSICLNGLGCDLAVPAGDRTLADFFAIGFNPKDGRLSVVFDRDNKKPDESLGHIATPMVVSQIAGPSNGGGTVSVPGHAVVRTSSADPTGDALSNYSLTAPGVAPPSYPAKNEAAADLTNVSVAGDPVTGGLKVTLTVANLSTTALTQALADTAGQSLLWVWRFANGYQDSAASARWSPLTGFTFGWNDYTTGGSPCAGATNAQGEKCVVYPGNTAIAGSVDQAAGTITLVIPKTMLRQLSGTDADGRPLEAPAASGARFYDGTAFTFANNAGADAGRAVVPLHAGQHTGDGLHPAVASGRRSRVVQRPPGSASSISVTCDAREAIGSSTSRSSSGSSLTVRWGSRRRSCPRTAGSPATRQSRARSARRTAPTARGAATRGRCRIARSGRA